MSTIRTLMMIAVLTAGSAACHDKSAKPAGESAEKLATADKPAADKPATDKPASATDKPAAKVVVSDADAQRYYALVEKLVAVAVANQDDCAKLAAGVNALLAENEAVIKDASEMRQHNMELPPAVKDKMAKKFSDELGPAVTKKCAQDKAVMAAFQKLKAR
jgi:hypothetical protein